MKDRFFYPLALAFIAGVVVLALSLGARDAAVSDAAIAADGFVIRGDSLAFLTAAPGTTFEVPARDSGQVDHAVLAAHIARDQAPPSAGVFANLNATYKRAFAGEVLNITIHAKQGADNPTPRFEMAYFAVGGGASGWRVFDLGPEFADYSFQFQPKLPTGAGEVDYFGIWPDPDGLQRTMDVKWMRVTIVPDSTRGDDAG